MTSANTAAPPATEDHEPIRPEPPKTFYEGAVKTPGYREPPERCRALTPVGFCEDGHTVLGRSSCGTRYCPDHWRDWNEEAVISMVARFAAYRHAVDGAEKRWHHLVASPPQDRRYSLRSLWETRSEAYEALKAAGVRGGAAVTHPYRTNDRGDALFEAAADAGELDEGTGRWDFLREVSDGWDDLARYIEAAPHYHAMGAAPDVEPDDAPDEWVVKRIRTMKPFHYRDTETYRAMVAPAYYVLTHAAEQEGRQSVTYFGDVHPASFNPEEELTAAVWSRIQMEAEKAVREQPQEEGEGGPMGAGPDDCPHDDCEAAVVDVYYLMEYLEDEDFKKHVLSHRDGRQRWLRLRGLVLWWDHAGDRPPPTVQDDKTRLQRWLEWRGESVTVMPGDGGPPSSHQVTLETAVMES
jgi:hypothetical protein